MKYFSVIILISILLVGLYAVFNQKPVNPTIPDFRAIRIQSRNDYLGDVERDLKAVDLELLDYELNLQ